MKIVKYFYAKPTFVQNVNVIVDENGDPLCDDLRDKCTTRKMLPRLTICGVYDSETKILKIGVARCSPKDLFVKEIGRKLAEERAETNPIHTTIVHPNEVISHVFFNLAKTLENRYSLLKSISF